MKKNNIKKAIAISGVIGGMVLIKPISVQAFENNEGTFTEPVLENINTRTTSRGQVVNVDGTYLRIRSNASTDSEILGTMSEGMNFEIVSKSGSWYKIRYNSIVGYVHGDYVEEINSTSNESMLYYGKVYNAAPNLRVRSSASLDSSVIGYVVDNAAVAIVGTEGKWYKIKYNDAYGYVHGDYILVNGTSSDDNIQSSGGDDTVRQTGYVYDLGGSSLRVRSAASTSSEVVGSLYDGDSVNIVGEEGNWYRISYNSSVAYVSKDYVTLSKVPDSSQGSNDSSGSGDSVSYRGTVINVAGSNLRVRKDASTSSFVVGYLLNGSTVDIVGSTDGWYKILFNGSIGYVSSDYISTDFNDGMSGTTSSEDTYNMIFYYMYEHIGAPYVWGGAGEYLTSSFLEELKLRFPAETAEGEYIHAQSFVDKGYRAFDCSGLMQWAFRQAGINIGRTTYDQIYDGVEVSINDVKKGDLIFTSDLGHVGMYIGENKWIESSFTGDNVRISNVPWDYVSRARRIL